MIYREIKKAIEIIFKLKNYRQHKKMHIFKMLLNANETAFSQIAER